MLYCQENTYKLLFLFNGISSINSIQSRIDEFLTYHDIQDTSHILKGMNMIVSSILPWNNQMKICIKVKITSFKKGQLLIRITTDPRNNMLTLEEKASKIDCYSLKSVFDQVILNKFKDDVIVLKKL